MDLPTKAEVHCSDGMAGRSTYVIGNLTNYQVTHLVVKSLRPPFSEHLVPVDQVKYTSPHLIELKCIRSEMGKMEAFAYEEYARTEIPTYLGYPHILPITSVNEEVPIEAPVKYHNFAPDEFAVCPGAQVEAIDGYIGEVDELRLDSANMRVTHLLLHKRHVFEQIEIAIPVSQIERVDPDVIYLKLDQQSIEALFTPPNERWPV